MLKMHQRTENEAILAHMIQKLQPEQTDRQTNSITASADGKRIDVFQEPVSWPKKYPHFAVKVWDGAENRIMYESLY